MVLRAERDVTRSIPEGRLFAAVRWFVVNDRGRNVFANEQAVFTERVVYEMADSLSLPT
jgi:hypothetical protein